MGAEIIAEDSRRNMRRTELHAKCGSWWTVLTYKRRRETVYETVVDKERRARDGLQVKDRQRVAVREASTWERAMVLHDSAVGAIQRDGKMAPQ